MKYIFLPGIKEDVSQAAAVVQEAELLRGSRAAALPSRIDGRVNPYWVLFGANKMSSVKLTAEDISLRKYFLKGDANENNKT